jgi:hypothetical protein
VHEPEAVADRAQSEHRDQLGAGEKSGSRGPGTRTSLANWYTRLTKLDANLPA